MHKIILHQRVVIPLPATTNLVTRMASVDEEVQGLYFEPLVQPIGQQLTNMAAAATAIHRI